MSSRNDDDDCVVCMDSYSSTCINQLVCRHKVCFQCQLRLRHDICPMCRKNLSSVGSVSIQLARHCLSICKTVGIWMELFRECYDDVFFAPRFDDDFGVIQ